jgi:hypothetical protein
MTKISTSFLLLLVCPALAQDTRFPGLKRVMDPETYARSGLRDLSPEQRAVLDAAIGDYVATWEKDVAAAAAAHAVDVAVKERKVRPPELIESRIVGDFTGYSLRTFFHLANGQVWRPTNDDVMPHSVIPSPSVVIFRDTFGYKMFIEGAGIVRVKRVN